MPNGQVNHRSILSPAPLIVLLLLGFAMNHTSQAEEQPPSDAKLPRVALCHPLGLSQLGATKFTLRGWSLKGATEVTTDDDGVTIKILNQGSAPVPGRQKTEEIGDEQLELEVTLPDSFDQSDLQLTVVTSAGKSKPHRLLVKGEAPIIDEVEPNDGFRQAQLIAFPQIVAGNLHADGNVDVFALELTQAQSLRIEVIAATLGSNFDSVLTLYTDSGKILSSNDDAGTTHDSLIETMLTPGRYLVTLQDAHDHSGPAHPYRLKVTPQQESAP
ncbi:MAG: DVUA0089 family protein [Planctomycetaceae bacterium]